MSSVGVWQLGRGKECLSVCLSSGKNSLLTQVCCCVYLTHILFKEEQLDLVEASTFVIH